MLKYEYVGPVDTIETVLDGRVRTVKRGEVIEVTPHAAGLLDLVPANWRPVKTRRNTTSEDD